MPSTHLFIRKSHRYLGLFIGIQFLFWTISGLYFSWNDIDEVHGDHMRKNPAFLTTYDVVSPAVAINNLKVAVAVDSIHSVRLINVLGKPTYQISYFSGHTGDVSHLHVHYALADGSTGALRNPLTEAEAKRIALEHVAGNATIVSTTYLARADGHHEFREKPLPAWAVSMKDPDCTVYISAELGTFQSIRHDQWRVFDFLWMFHTMDYEHRDNFNNVLLKSFSILGLVTVVSGFALFVVSSRTLKKLNPQS